MSAPKKVFIFWFLFISIVFGLVFTSVPVFAAGIDMKPITRENWSPEAQTTYSYDNTMNSALFFLTGISLYSEYQPTRTLSENGQIQLALVKNTPGGGAMGALAGAMGALYSPPTSTTQYLADLSTNLGLTKPVYAQGVSGSGSNIVRPVLELWQIVRNLAYLFFIVIFIVTGLMIMFRQKINPQTVISLQAALPGLVLGLILVTFSYFISALIIDLSFLGIQLIAQIFMQIKDSSGNVMNVFDIQTLAKNSNIFDLFSSSAFRMENVGDVFSGLSNTISSITPQWVPGNGATVQYALPSILTGLIAGILAATFPAAAVGAVIGLNFVPIVSIIIPLILIIALFIQFFKLFFKLLGAYIAILVSTLTSPFIILFASLPGRGGNLSAWWKTLLANALIFPAVFAAFMFAGVILKTDINSWGTSPPLFGGLRTDLLKLVVAYGILLGTAAIPDMVKNAIGVKDVQGIPQAALGGFMGGASVGQTAVVQGRNRLWGTTNQQGAYQPGPIRNLFEWARVVNRHPQQRP